MPDWLRNLRLRPRRMGARLGSEIDRELSIHVQMQIEENIEAGMSVEMAREKAFQTFGILSRVRQEARDVRQSRMEKSMDNFWQDLRFSVRLLIKRPLFTLAVVFILAIGFGASLTFFSLLNNVVLNPLPEVEDAAALVNVKFSASSFPNFEDVRDATQTLDGLSAFADYGMALGETDGPARLILGLVVSDHYFEVLGVEPTAGRLIGAEVGSTMPQTPEAVMSYSLWQRLFGGDPSVVGRTVRLNGIPFTIIGVAPKGFAGTFVGFNIEMWVPLEMAALVAPRLDLVSRHADRLEWVARVRPGLDVRKVRSELQTIAARLRRQYPEANRELKAEVTTVTGIDEEFRAGVIGFLGVMIAVGLMVLLIASLNVVNMMLARAAGRSREMAVRLALGASRRRLLAQLLSEHLILGLAAGTGGLVFAWMSSRLLSQWSPSLPLPISINLTPDWRVVMAAFVLSVLIAVWIGMLTALRSTRPQLVQALKEGGGRGSTASRPRGLLVTAQIAVSMVLLVCAGLFIRTLHYADRAEVGFNTEGVQVSPLLEPSLLRMNPEEARRFYVQLYQRLQNLPGSRSASLVGRLPLSFFGSSTAVVLSPGTDSSAPREELKYDFTVVSPGYFETLQIPFKAGRDFGLEDEMDSAAAAVVSEAFARRFWPHRDELGQTFSADGRQIRVVGVVGDVKQNSLSEVAEPFFYVPFTQHPSSRMAIVTRSAQSSAALSRAVRRQVEEIAAGLPVSEFTPVKDFLAISLIAQRLAGGAAALLGVIGLILAAAGLYGLISYSVTQRKAEFGIRYSLGARQSDVLRLVVRGGLKLTLAGLLLGGVLALGTTRFLESLLYGISPRDPLTFLAIALLLTATTLLASYLPVRKAAAVDPAQALRSE